MIGSKSKRSSYLRNWGRKKKLFWN